MARQFGRYFEDFEVGDVYRHWPGKTITEYDDHLFCAITWNHHPLHTNQHYAETATQFGRNVVVGNLVYSLALGMSVPDVSGRAIANLEVESLKHSAPFFHGDTLYAETTVLDRKESGSKPDRGVVTVETRGYNQDGVGSVLPTEGSRAEAGDDGGPARPAAAPGGLAGQQEPCFGHRPGLGPTEVEPPTRGFAEARGHEESEPQPALAAVGRHVFLDEGCEEERVRREVAGVGDLEGPFPSLPVGPDGHRPLAVPDGVVQELGGHSRDVVGTDARPRLRPDVHLVGGLRKVGHGPPIAASGSATTVGSAGPSPIISSPETTRSRSPTRIREEPTSSDCSAERPASWRRRNVPLITASGVRSSWPRTWMNSSVPGQPFGIRPSPAAPPGSAGGGPQLQPA